MSPLHNFLLSIAVLSLAYELVSCCVHLSVSVSWATHIAAFEPLRMLEISLCVGLLSEGQFGANTIHSDFSHTQGTCVCAHLAKFSLHGAGMHVGREDNGEWRICISSDR